jgi:hypothetical protein
MEKIRKCLPKVNFERFPLSVQLYKVNFERVGCVGLITIEIVPQYAAKTTSLMSERVATENQV